MKNILILHLTYLRSKNIFFSVHVIGTKSIYTWLDPSPFIVVLLLVRLFWYHAGKLDLPRTIDVNMEAAHVNLICDTLHVYGSNTTNRIKKIICNFLE